MKLIILTAAWYLLQTALYIHRARVILTARK